MTKRQKILLILFAVLVWSAVACVAVFFLKAPAQTPAQTPPLEKQGHLGGLMNPDNITDPTPVTKNEVDTTKSEQPTMSLVSQPVMIQRAEKELASGNYESLDSYLFEIEMVYRDKGMLDSPPMTFIERVRGDLAMITGITKDNGGQLLQMFMTPDVLASAMVYLPISSKYLAFINVDSIVIPAEERGTISSLKRELDPEIEKARVEALNEGREQAFVEAAIYYVTLYGRPFELTLVLRDNGFWAPYLMSTEDTTDLLNVQKTKNIALVILDTGNSLDDMIAYD